MVSNDQMSVCRADSSLHEICPLLMLMLLRVCIRALGAGCVTRFFTRRGRGYTDSGVGVSWRTVDARCLALLGAGI
jgi:hypothetical protein